ncbi:MAG: D-alanyl-D-alanine carboxypeptidase/D-alanyl-D-alanine-endopeptidase [Bacteroidales bacterium]|nr:D-alanyl-D-alanine carboxypeptidase/D-alanyl-D-alanine-endopeptidase [Bacteroidales bacterium]
MRIHFPLISVALLLTAWSATAGIPRTGAQKAIEAIRGQVPLNSAQIGVLAVRADGDTLVALNAAQRLVPASNVKLLTTGLALHTLGPDFRFETRIAYTGPVQDGVLRGDVYILGGGDPTTGARKDCAEEIDRTFSAWTKLLADAGIRSVEGRILGDPRCFSSPTPQHLGWTFDDLGTYYGAGPTGLNFFENAQNFLITPGGAASATHYRVQYPETPWMRVVNHTVTGPARTANTLYYINSTLAPVGELAGSFPADRRGYTLECSNAFGAYTCAWYFYNYLNNHGLSVKGGWGDVTPQGEVRVDLSDVGERQGAAGTDALTVLGSTFSAPLPEIVRVTNYESDNFFAETLLKTLSLHSGRTDGPDDCEETLEAAMRSLGLRTDGACQQVDGSGLSRKNYIAPAFFVRFLRKMMTLPVWEPYFYSLPVPGHEGTLEDRFPHASPEFRNRIHMKTGSMNGVRCFSGYILAADGAPDHTIIFSVLVNNCPAPSYRMVPTMDAIIEAIAAENE